MKRSEFAAIVNKVSQAEANRLIAEVQKAKESDSNSFAAMIAQIAVSIPDVAARTTADILVRSGLISLEED